VFNTVILYVSKSFLLWVIVRIFKILRLLSDTLRMVTVFCFEELIFSTFSVTKFHSSLHQLHLYTTRLLGKKLTFLVRNFELHTEATGKHCFV